MARQAAATATAAAKGGGGGGKSIYVVGNSDAALDRILVYVPAL